MAMNYAVKYSGIVDEKFRLGAMTANAVNSDYDFVGAKTVYVYGIPTVGLTDYKRSGQDRYGTPAELENTKQEMTLNMDRAFSFTIDRANYEDTQMSSAAGQALNREIEEVVIPEIDRYRLAKLFIGAGTVNTTALVNGNYYEQILNASEAISDAKVPVNGRVIFVKTSFFNKLKLDDNFIKASDIGQDMLIKGSLGMIDGMNVFVLPASYMPFGCDFIITHAKAMTAPYKLAEYKVHDNPPGINGWLVEGRVYFDAFVLGNKKDAVYVKQTAAQTLTVTLAAGTGGKTKVSIAGVDDILLKAGAKLVYKTGSNTAAATLGADVSGWTAVTGFEDGAFEETLTSGNKIAAAISVGGKAYAVSSAVTIS